MLDGRIGLLRTLPPPDPSEVTSVRRSALALGLPWPDGAPYAAVISALDPTVRLGASLRAGATVGLVGMTGHASGPHLHLQLQPATSYPQIQPWFEGFAGIAFRWQDAPTPLRSLEGASPVQTRVAGLSDDSGPVIGFTR